MTNFVKKKAFHCQAVRKLFENHLRKHKLDLDNYLKSNEEKTLDRKRFSNII